TRERIVHRLNAPVVGAAGTQPCKQTIRAPTRIPDAWNQAETVRQRQRTDDITESRRSSHPDVIGQAAGLVRVEGAIPGEHYRVAAGNGRPEVGRASRSGVRQS